jgi:cyclopropane-fatty-acyl-phospholipid synthase
MDIASVPTDGSGRVLEIGNGWGSFLLYAAAKHPQITFLGFSNSATQQEHISRDAEARGLTNVKSLKCDINDFCDHGLPGAHADTKFDRIFSCECLEHSKDYGTAFEAMSKVLKDTADAKVFVQILCHREYTYFMNGDDWMGRNFFTGGTIPSTKLFLFFSDHLVVDDCWFLSGTEYARTLDAWLAQMHNARARLTAVFKAHKYASPRYEFQKWRMFYIMSSVSFGFNGGNEWMVAYYTFKKR